jgi:hypothetical protein
MKNSPGGAAGKYLLTQRDKKMITRCTTSLADPELAEILKRVMEKEITRRRILEAKPGR